MEEGELARTGLKLGEAEAAVRVRLHGAPRAEHEDRGTGERGEPRAVEEHALDDTTAGLVVHARIVRETDARPGLAHLELTLLRDALQVP